MSGQTINAAVCAIFSGDQLLLIQRAYAPLKGYWALPGGRIEIGETPEECMRREIREELSLDIEHALPVTILDGGGGFLLQTYVTKLATGAPNPSDEIADWCWCALGGLSQYKTTPNLVPTVTAAAQMLTRL